MNGVRYERVSVVVKRTCEARARGEARRSKRRRRACLLLCGLDEAAFFFPFRPLCHSRKLKAHHPLTHHTLPHPLHSPRTTPSRSPFAALRTSSHQHQPSKSRSTLASSNEPAMAPPSSRRLFLGLLLLSLFQGLQSLKDYHNIFCGKENCYDVLGVPQVSSSRPV